MARANDAVAGTGSKLASLGALKGDKMVTMLPLYVRVNMNSFAERDK
jgi:hypothetical protein